MQLQPIVRVILTALAAGIGAAATQIDNETLRIAAAIVVPTLAAIGIIPPQVPTKTVVDPSKEAGYSIVEAILVVFLVAVVLIVLFHFA